MRIVLVLIMLFLVLAIFPSAGFAQDKTPKYSNEFLNLGVGGRALGMGNTHSALSDDVTSGYWNPAGLVRIKKNYEAAFMHASYFAGIANYDYLAFATPIDSLSHIGGSILRFAVDDIPDTRFLYDANGNINYDNIRFFSAADYAFLMTYARKIPKLKDIRIGANVKVIHRKVGEFASAWGFGLDAGAQITLNNWELGLTYRDIFGTFNAWSHNPEFVEDVYSRTGNEIPQNSVEITLPRLIAGVAYPFRFKDKWGLLPAMDLDITFDGKRNVVLGTSLISIDPRVGLEFDYDRIAFLRIGINQFQRIKDFDGSNYLSYQPTLGLGASIKALTLDYAFLDVGDQSESLYSHIFSIKLSFD